MDVGQVLALVWLNVCVLVVGLAFGWRAHQMWGDTKCMHRTHAESRRILDALRRHADEQGVDAS